METLLTEGRWWGGEGDSLGRHQNGEANMEEGQGHPSRGAGVRGVGIILILSWIYFLSSPPGVGIFLLMKLCCIGTKTDPNGTFLGGLAGSVETVGWGAMRRRASGVTVRLTRCSFTLFFPQQELGDGWAHSSPPAPTCQPPLPSPSPGGGSDREVPKCLQRFLRRASLSGPHCSGRKMGLSAPCLLLPEVSWEPLRVPCELPPGALLGSDHGQGRVRRFFQLRGRVGLRAK